MVTVSASGCWLRNQVSWRRANCQVAVTIFFFQLYERQFPGQMVADQPVTECLICGGGGEQAMIDQFSGFVDPAGGKHLRGAFPDAFFEFFPFPDQVPDNCRTAGVFVPGLLLGGDRFAGEFQDFQGAKQLAVVLAPARIRRRVADLP